MVPSLMSLFSPFIFHFLNPLCQAHEKLLLAIQLIQILSLQMVPTFHHTILFNTSNSVNSHKNTNTNSYTNEFYEIAHTWFVVKKGNVNFLNFLSKHMWQVINTAKVPSPNAPNLEKYPEGCFKFSYVSFSWLFYNIKKNSLFNTNFEWTTKIC